MSSLLRRLLPVLPLVLASCVNVGTMEHRREQARLLSLDVQKLSPTVSVAEADRLAATAIEASAQLNREFKPMHFPWANNALRNMGLRERGLCYEWRDALFPHLFMLRLKTLDLHLASAFRGTPREHNGIIVTAKGQDFYDGLILDPWRKGGRLWWGRFYQDKGHKWKPLPWELTPMALRPYLMPELYPAEAARVRQLYRN